MRDVTPSRPEPGSERAAAHRAPATSPSSAGNCFTQVDVRTHATGPLPVCSGRTARQNTGWLPIPLAPGAMNAQGRSRDGPRVAVIVLGETAGGSAKSGVASTGGNKERILLGTVQCAPVHPFIQQEALPGPFQDAVRIARKDQLMDNSFSSQKYF